MRSGDDADDLGLDAEMAERLDQLAGQVLLVLGIGADLLAGPVEHPDRRGAVDAFLGHGRAAGLAHRRECHLCGRLDRVDLVVEGDVVIDGYVVGHVFDFAFPFVRLLAEFLFEFVEFFF